MKSIIMNNAVYDVAAVRNTSYDVLYYVLFARTDRLSVELHVDDG